MNKLMFHPSKRVIWFLIAAYGAPLVAYFAIFGPALSSDHQRWAEFGSAMSGIYAPIVAVTTLAVLLAQVGLQKQINDHSYDQAHFEQARADIEFYAIQLAGKLDQIALPGQTFRSVLHFNFQPRTVAELDSDSLRTLAANIDAAMPGVMSMWFGVYPILAGLATSDQAKYRMTLNSSLQKLIALLSFETCVALDNYHRARTEGQLKVVYQFSMLLKPKPAV
jgi:hypothetical protein